MCPNQIETIIIRIMKVFQNDLVEEDYTKLFGPYVTSEECEKCFNQLQHK